MEEIKKYKHKIDSTDVNFAKYICSNKKYTVCELPMIQKFHRLPLNSSQVSASEMRTTLVRS